MSKITDAKRARAAHKILKTPDGLEYVSPKLAFKPPAAKELRTIEYQGQKMHIWCDKGQRINPKRIFKKEYKKFLQAKKASGEKLSTMEEIILRR